MKKVRGFSLVELLVALAIGVVLMTGVVQMFLSSKTVFITQQGISRVQETGRLAIDFMAEDIRQAGFFGCISRKLNAPGNNNNKKGPVSMLNDSGSLLFDFELGLQAFSTAPGGLALSPAPIEGSPVLIVRAASGSGVDITADQMSNSHVIASNPQGATGAGCESGVCKDDILLISDCAKALVFQASDVQSQGGNEMKIDHSSGGATPGNKYPSWGGPKQSNSRSFGAGSEIIKMETLVYYIANNTKGRPSLYKKEGTAVTSLELVEGVEDMNFSFGIDNVFIDLAAVTDWSLVQSVQVELLVQSTDDNVVPETQTYTFAGSSVTAPDKRIRQVFSSVVGIRSKLE